MTTLTRTRPLKRRTSLRGKSKKRLKIRVRKQDLAWAKAVKERDGYLCRRCRAVWRDEVASYIRITGTGRGAGDIPYPITPRGLHACHIFGRSKRVTRWDLDNGLTLCMGCHLYFHGHPLEFIEFAKQELGEKKFEALRRKAQIPSTEGRG